MDLIVWDDKFSVGMNEIDSQHKVFIILINELQKSIASKRPIVDIQKVYNALSKYVDEHFSYEEDILKKHSYPFIKEHLEEHDKFRLYLIKLNQNILNNKNTDAKVLFNFLQNWFVNHILHSDKKYGDYIKQKMVC